MKKTNIPTIQKESIDLSKTEKALEKYKKVKGALIPVLQMIQYEYGYLPEAAIDLIAEEYTMTPSEIIGVATFYSQFHLEQRGKHIIKVCCGTACHVKGANKIAEKLCGTLDVSMGMTTQDKEFTLEGVACLGACSLAPVMMVDEEVHGKLAPDTVGTVIHEIKTQGTSHT
ncbi:MAG: NADH-quinone oxidoreductase subunit NuoE [Candidatus Brocadiaceae bacterium]|nr:NADH-quinone oxidoreductase subunit NuoE [Candidatus Brocadiaceae bacterium]